MSNNTKIQNIRDKCTGCGACQQICPVNCIEMKRDDEGFMQPIVNENCIGCKKCEKVCPIISGTIKHEILETFKGYTTDGNILKQSTSGGIFGELCRESFKRNGIVYGAQYSNDFSTVYHSSIDKMDEIYKFQGSKYIQSNINNMYIDVMNTLQKDKFIVFSGTPCQIAGLNNFLGAEYSKLITCDFLCHGVASEKIYNMYIEYLNQSGLKQKVSNVKFRSKILKYVYPQFEIQYENGTTKSESFYDNNFGFLFKNNVISRECCSTCAFANTKRTSDISIADYVGDDMSEDEKINGISFIFVNTSKGKEYFESIEKKMKLEKLDLTQVVSRCMHLRESPRASHLRKRIFTMIDKNGFAGAVDRVQKYYLIKNRIRTNIIFRVFQKIFKLFGT